MRIITEPTVYLVGKQTVDQDELTRFLEDHAADMWTTDAHCGAEAIAEIGGRLCYMSFARPRPGGNAAYLAHIREAGHTSVYEHGVFSLIIVGVSRSLLAEFTRHRVGMSPSVLSQRYVDESVAEYVEPDIIAADPELHAIWLDAVTHAHAKYVELAEKLGAKIAAETLASKDSDRPWKCGGCFGSGTAFRFGETRENEDGEMVTALIPVGKGCPSCKGSGFAREARTEMRKAARQAARSVLPNATETKISVTANARALRHFLEQRGSRHAEPEIRKLANVMLDILQAEAPNLFGDYVKTPLPDGTAEITTPNPKV